MDAIEYSGETLNLPGMELDAMVLEPTTGERQGAVGICASAFVGFGGVCHVASPAILLPKVEGEGNMEWS
jgi:hypothetical protein